MPNPNIFFLDEDDGDGEDPLDRAARATHMAAADDEQLQNIYWQTQHLEVDGDDDIPNAALLPFNLVQELIKRESQKQGKLIYQATPVPSNHFTVEVDNIIMVACYYGLVMACFLMVLSLLIHR